MSAERAKHAVAGFYDDYLNGFFRSLKCWRRGNTLGGRLEAAESANSLLHLLFALEQRWRPFSTGSPTRQQTLMRRVVPLLRERGYGYVYDDWEGQIDQALDWRFS